MARVRLHAAKVLALAGLLIAGVGASAALATPGTPNAGGPPPTVPGSPGDDCSHGNSGKDCRPDPSTNGKDCQDHGNASGNEDHCDQASTTTTTTPDSSTTSTSSSTTSTNSSTTTSTTSTTSGGSTSTPSTSTSATLPTNGTTTASAPTTTGATAAASTPPTKQELQKELAKQVKGVRATTAGTHSNPRELPFTGFPAWVIALIGAAMVSAGLFMRRVSN